jgi:N-formylmaleamate deformylase
MTTERHYGAHLDVNGVRIHYLHHVGHGQRLVIVPGISSPAATWNFVAARFAPEFDVYVIDLRGRGLSSSDDELDFGTAACVADVEALIERLGLVGCHVLGHSLGARIVARLAAERPERAGRLVLVDPPVSGPGRRPFPVTLENYLVTLQRAKRGELDADELREVYPRWSEAQRRVRAEWLPTCSLAATEASYRSFLEEDLHADIAQLRMPTMLMVAGQGGTILPDEIEELRRVQPRLRIASMPDCGHMIPFEDLEGFHSSVASFLGTR